jgi:Rha family phage regulatory protein
LTVDKLAPFHEDEYGVTAHKDRPVATSIGVARVFGKEHYNVLRDIKELTEPKSGLSKDFTDLNFEGSYYKDPTGRRLPMYRLTRDGLTMLVMGYTGKKAMEFKEAYIRRFNEMEQFIEDLQQARADFPELTAAIYAAHEEPKPWHFSNEADLINRIVLGETAKEFKESHGIPNDAKTIRPYLTGAQIKQIEKLQKFDTGLVLTEPDYQRRKEILSRYYLKIMNSRLLTA